MKLIVKGGVWRNTEDEVRRMPTALG